MNSLYQNIRLCQRHTLEYLVKHFFADSLRRRAQDVVSVFAGWFGQTGTWLDVGGSWGFCAFELKQRGWDTLVVDVVKPAVQAVPVLIYPGDRLPFENESWDVVSMITMLHHVPDPAALVKEAARVSKRYVMLAEDLDGFGGRFWTVLRDQIFNLEFVGHPKQFRKENEWPVFFAEQGLKLVRFEKVVTRLLGMKIENGFYLFEKMR